MTRKFDGIFNKVLKDREKITFFNTYDWLTVANPGKILGVGEDSITCQVTEHQAICMQIEQNTLMQVDSVLETIAGHVMALDIRSFVVILNDFHFAGRFVNKRNCVRVPPTEPIEVVFPDRPLAKGRIEDISIEGIGIVVNRSAYTYSFFAEGSEINISFSLPLSASGNPTPFFIRGMIKNFSYHQGDTEFRIGMKFQGQRSLLQLITQYISMRSLEVLSELTAQRAKWLEDADAAAMKLRKTPMNNPNLSLPT